MSALPPEFLQAARALIAARSVTSEGNLPAVAVMQRLYEEAGLTTQRLASPDTPARDANLLAFAGPALPTDPLLLVTHLDTVSTGPRDAWTHDPFALTIEGDHAYGLGSADVKLDALCKLWAWKRLAGETLQRGVAFLGTYGEEAGLRGTKEFLRNPPFRPFGVLCGEPSSLRLCHAHKGYAMVRVRLVDPSPERLAITSTKTERVEGKAVHSSTPHLGVNAADRFLSACAQFGGVVDVVAGESTNTLPGRCDLTLATGVPDPAGVPTLDALFPFVVRVRELWSGLCETLQPSQDGRFVPSGAVANLTRLRKAGSPVGAAVEFHLDARLLPGHDPRGLLEPFIEAVGARVAPFAVEVSIERDAPGMALAESDPFVVACGGALASVGLDPQPRAKPTSTEAGAFSRAGIPALVFGPSRSEGNAHAADEHASVADLARAIDAYEALLRKLCT